MYCWPNNFLVSKLWQRDTNYDQISAHCPKFSALVEFRSFSQQRGAFVLENNLRALNGVVFWAPLFIPSKLVFSDASSTGCVAFIQGSGLVFHTNWSLEESQKSSTWRELATIKAITRSI